MGLLGEAGRMLGTTVNAVVPPEAQVHLLNAQRELLLAVEITIAHHARRDAAAERRAKRQSRRPTRVELE